MAARCARFSSPTTPPWASRPLELSLRRRQLAQETEVPAHVALHLAVLRIRPQHLLIEGEGPRDVGRRRLELALREKRHPQRGVAVRLVAAGRRIGGRQPQPPFCGFEGRPVVRGGFRQAAADPERPSEVAVDAAARPARAPASGAGLQPLSARPRPRAVPGGGRRRPGRARPSGRRRRPAPRGSTPPCDSWSRKAARASGARQAAPSNTALTRSQGATATRRPFIRSW